MLFNPHDYRQMTDGRCQYIYAFEHIPMYTNKHICIYTYEQIHIYMNIYNCMHGNTYMYTYEYIHVSSLIPELLLLLLKCKKEDSEKFSSMPKPHS